MNFSLNGDLPKSRSFGLYNRRIYNVGINTCQEAIRYSADTYICNSESFEQVEQCHYIFV